MAKIMGRYVPWQNQKVDPYARQTFSLNATKNIQK